MKPATSCSRSGVASAGGTRVSVTVPVLLLRGAQSDVLLQATAEDMTLRGPRARLVEFDGIGHAPTLVAADQVEVVRQWLTE